MERSYRKGAGRLDGLHLVGWYTAGTFESSAMLFHVGWLIGTDFSGVGGVGVNLLTV